MPPLSLPLTLHRRILLLYPTLPSETFPLRLRAIALCNDDVFAGDAVRVRWQI